MLRIRSTTSWQHCDGSSVIPYFESFQLLEDCDHNVDKLGAHMKPLFDPIWREFIYDEAKGVIMVALLYWSSVILQFNLLGFLGESFSHYLQIVGVEISLQFHWYINLFGKSHEPQFGVHNLFSISKWDTIFVSTCGSF
jgi:hypothetical protein